MERLIPLMDWKTNQVWSQATVPSPLITLSSPNAGLHTVMQYFSNGPLRKKFWHLLVQNLTQADISSQSINKPDWLLFSWFHTSNLCEWATSSSLKSCDTVAKMNFSCASDTSASTAAVSGKIEAMCRVDSASDDTFYALRGTETPFYETNGVSPATDPTLRYCRKISLSRFTGTGTVDTRGRLLWLAGHDSHWAFWSTKTRRFGLKVTANLLTMWLLTTRTKALTFSFVPWEPTPNAGGEY